MDQLDRSPTSGNNHQGPVRRLIGGPNQDFDARWGFRLEQEVGQRRRTVLEPCHHLAGRRLNIGAGLEPDGHSPELTLVHYAGAGSLEHHLLCQLERGLSRQFGAVDLDCGKEGDAIGP